MPATHRIAISVALLPLAAAAGCQPHRAPAAGESVRVAEPGESALRTSISSPSSRPAAAGTLYRDVPPETGRHCRVHLRRDAMGLAGVAPMPLSPRGSTPSSRALTLDGILEAVGDHWVVLRTAERTYSLPVGSILAIEYTDGAGR